MPTAASALHDKIVDLDHLVRMVESARAAGKTIVQCHGCFDIVHPGHVRYLEFARAQGDLLIVTLTGDSGMAKGEDRPYIPQELRAENLAAIMFVDAVSIVPAPTAEAVLAAIKPDIYVKGKEYERSSDPGFLAEQRVVESYGGRIIFSSGEIVFSSSKLIEHMPRSAETESHRLNLLCRRQGITGDGIAAALDGFRNLRVLVVGDVVLDRYVFCDAIGVASEAPMMSLAHLDERTYVGGAAIIARHLAALGAKPFLLSAGGDDSACDHVRTILHAEGVAFDLLSARPSVVEKTRFLVGDTKLFKLDKAHRLPLDSRAERRAAMILEQQSKIADAVILCDFGYGMITAGLLERSLPALRQNVRTITADVSGGRANLLLFRHVDLLCPTEREVRAALSDYDSGLSAAAWHLLHRTQARHLIITLEKRGMVVFERPGQQRGGPEWEGRLKGESIPSFAEYAVDRLGCGDALLAASTLALAAGATLHQAAYLGNAAAAIEINMLGNHPVTIDAMRAWVRGRAELEHRATPVLRSPAQSALVATPAGL